MEASTDAVASHRRHPAGDPLGRSSAIRILLAGATGVIGRQAVPVLAAAGHEVVGLARTLARLPDAEAVAADALDPAAVQRAVLVAAPDVIVHMLTASPTRPTPGTWPATWP